MKSALLSTSSNRVPGGFRPQPLLTVALLLLLASGNGFGQGSARRWTGAIDETGELSLVDATDHCLACITFEEVVVLGDTDDGSGLLEETGQVDDIVQDHEGRYWVGGQRGAVKVFDAQGNFLREVGRMGQGPMEFQQPRPSHVDELGRVHVHDTGNRRVTIVGPDFELVEAFPLPGMVRESASLPGASRYVVQMLAADVGGRRRPLHIVDRAEVVYSFGAAVEEAGPRADSPFVWRRVATDRHGRVFSALLYEYLIEAWSPAGQRLGGFRGPTLNETFPDLGHPGFSLDSPPRTQIFAIAVDEDERLYVAMMQLRSDWLKQAVPMPGGPEGALMPEDGDVSLWFTSRIDIIDLPTATIVASAEHDGMLVRFLPGQRVVEIRYDEFGDLQLAIWRLLLKS